MLTIYGYLLPSNEEKTLSDKKDIIRMMKNPTLYTNETAALLSRYSIITDTVLPEIDETKFVDTAEYDVWYEGVVRLFTDPTFITNQIYKSFLIDDIVDHIVDGYVEYVWAGRIKFVIANTLRSFKLIYPEIAHYYVVYDESQNVTNDEMLTLMAQLCNELGKENIYDSVRQWNYFSDEGVKTSFYIFYSGSKPSDLICQEVIRNYVIKKYGLEEAKRRFPRLFITTVRKVFCLYDNKILPIDYAMLSGLIEEYNILMPEIIHVLDYISPIIIEYGLSDIYPNYTSQQSTDPLVNTFLYYISSILNYYNGKKLTRDFIQESQFRETDDYCSVVTAGIEWWIMKKSYRGSYYQIDND